MVYSGKAGDVSSYQSDDGALSSELCRAEERPDEAVDEFVLWVDNRVVVRNLLPLCVFRGGIIKDDLSGQRRKRTGETKRKNKNKRHKTDKQTKKKTTTSSRNRRHELTDSGCFFSSNMSSERFESLQVHNVKSAPVEGKIFAASMASKFAVNLMNDLCCLKINQMLGKVLNWCLNLTHCICCWGFFMCSFYVCWN